MQLYVPTKAQCKANDIISNINRKETIMGMCTHIAFEGLLPGVIDPDMRVKLRPLRGGIAADLESYV